MLMLIAPYYYCSRLGSNAQKQRACRTVLAVLASSRCSALQSAVPESFDGSGAPVAPNYGLNNSDHDYNDFVIGLPDSWDYVAVIKTAN